MTKSIRNNGLTVVAIETRERTTLLSVVRDTPVTESLHPVRKWYGKQLNCTYPFFDSTAPEYVHFPDASCWKNSKNWQRSLLSTYNQRIDLFVQVKRSERSTNQLMSTTPGCL